MKQWQYENCPAWNMSELNRLGLEGWEAFSTTGQTEYSCATVLLKRELPEQRTMKPDAM